MSLKDIIEQSEGRIELIEVDPFPRTPKAQCVECEGVFDLTDETDTAEWAYGHDCEVS